MPDDPKDKPTGVLARLLQETGVSQEEWSHDNAQGRFTPGKEVTRSAEFKRILALPRRDWEARDQTQVEAYFMEHLRAPGGTQKLRPVQIAGLWEMHARHGLFANSRTGSGKTLLSLLGFIVLGSVRPLLLVPASLRDKTLRDMNRYRKDWLVPPYIRILSYELLGREQSVNLLEEYNPDAIIADECFPWTTRVTTDVGDIEIGRIVEDGIGTMALSRARDGSIEWKKIVRRIPRPGERKLVVVQHDYGSFMCTPEHKVWTDEGYVEARHLRDHRLTIRRRQGDIVESRLTVMVDHGASADAVYDITVEGNHNYFANGVLVSNCHRMKNRSAAVVKRVARFVDSHPDVKVVAMSGTIAKRSIKDYAHISNWCLRAQSPVPRDFRTLVEWSAALDDQKDGNCEPGALEQFCSPEELSGPDRLQGVRKGYRRRLTETPGVIATQENLLGVSLRIDPFVVKDARITHAAAELKRTWERPDGVELVDVFDIWRHIRTCAVGFYYRWNPAPPKEWREARKTWAAAVREVLRTNRRGLDSEKPVKDAIDEGHYPHLAGYLKAWRDIEPVYDPEKNKEAVWLSYGMLEAVGKWTQKNPGIVWVQHVEFGKALAKYTGLSYYANQGRDQNDRFIEDHPKGTPMIASIASNSTGVNLQEGWSRNLIVSPPTTGLTWEQLISRTHRDGQPDDEVTVEVAAAIPEALMDFDKACQDARRATDMEGQEQRLCYADITIPPSADRVLLWT